MAVKYIRVQSVLAGHLYGTTPQHSLASSLRAKRSSRALTLVSREQQLPGMNDFFVEMYPTLCRRLDFCRGFM